MTTFKFSFYCSILLLLALNLTSYASDNAPQQLIIKVTDALEHELLTNAEVLRGNPALTTELIEKHLVPHINFPLMSRYVLGKNWRKIDSTQREEFIHLFHVLLVKFYSNAFSKYIQSNTVDKEMIKFLPFRSKTGSKYATVKSKITHNKNAPPIAVNYQLYNGKTKGWKVYDINVEGISLVTSYRSSFNQLIKQKGMQGLLVELQEKINKLNQEI